VKTSTVLVLGAIGLVGAYFLFSGEKKIAKPQLALPDIPSPADQLDTITAQNPNLAVYEAGTGGNPVTPVLVNWNTMS